MKKRNLACILVVIIILLTLAWSPWITKSYAENKVIEMLGGENAVFHYLGEDKKISEIPKYVLWLPFARGVYFENESVWFVWFWGGVLI